MRKANGDHAKTDEENAEVFAKHFRKVFNNPDPPPCDNTVLPSVPPARISPTSETHHHQPKFAASSCAWLMVKHLGHQ
eukprot:14729856-Ditylum_brightwellii.AAC.1